MADSPTAIDRLLGEVPPDQFFRWQFKAPPIADGRIQGIMPYSKVVEYFLGGMSHVAGMNLRNHEEARQATLDEDNTVVAHNGVKVGIVYARESQVQGRTLVNMWEEGGVQAGNLQDGIFNQARTIDDVIGGESPILTGLYPWIVLPNDEPSRYGLYVKFDPGVVGRKEEIVEREIKADDSYRQFDFSGLVSGSQDHVREAMQRAHSAAPGKYKVRLVYTDMPMVMVRVDGYRPVFMTFNQQGKIPVEVASATPIVPLGVKVDDPEKIAQAEGVFLATDGVQGEAVYTSTVPNPLASASRFGRFVESRLFYQIEEDANQGHQIIIPWMKTDVAGRTEVMDMQYHPLNRAKSAAMTDINPYLGMVEVQIAIVRKVVSAEVVEFLPDTTVPKVREREHESPRSRGIGELFLETREDAYSYGGGMRGGNVGYTTGAGLRYSPPTRSANTEWVAHRTAFRFVLTNDAISNMPSGK